VSVGIAVPVSVAEGVASVVLDAVWEVLPDVEVEVVEE